jgi:hypothetical protein
LDRRAGGPDNGVCNVADQRLQILDPIMEISDIWSLRTVLLRQPYVGRRIRNGFAFAANDAWLDEHDLLLETREPNTTAC